VLIEGGGSSGGGGGDSSRRRSRIISILIMVEYALVFVLSVLGYLKSWINSSLLGLSLSAMVLGILVLYTTERET
jgi:hypothetical protein